MFCGRFRNAQDGFQYKAQLIESPTMVNVTELRAPLSGGDKDVGPSVELFCYRSNAGAGTAPQLCSQSQAGCSGPSPPHKDVPQLEARGQLLLKGN